MITTPSPMSPAQVLRGRDRISVAMVTPRFHPFVGGVETHVHEVATRLAARGFEVTVLTADLSRRLPVREDLAGLRVLRFSATPWLGDLTWAPGIHRALVQGDWNLVHIQCVHTLVPALAMSGARRAGLPCVVSFHTGGHTSGLRRAFRPLQWRFQRPLLARAAALVAVSEFEAGLFQEALGLGPEHFAVISNGFDLPPADPDGHWSELRPPPRRPLILSVGRLERYKGHHRAIAAMPAVLRVHPDAELRVVGTGPYEQRLRRLVEATGLASHVRFVSFPPERRAELGRLVASADLVTLLSEYEANPVAVMEAVGLGRRVLVASTSGLRELAQQGLASEVSLQAPDWEIGELMAGLVRRPGPAVAPQLPTWDDCADRLAGVYREVLRRQETGSL
ncbi:MAG: glycosyltransferase family 4 protein [Candidatus Dormibacteraeota bacterium]|nr:glycosyltransferase family 4 protein [Candidatus Dormibacteraeota bacterium]MBO0701676.1 glycosyltransferase family 4 protein [Candidatus Dormibacteraeota bacterium]